MRLAPCSTCMNNTKHIVLHEKQASYHIYRMLECAGCGRICLEEELPWKEKPKPTYYPSPVSRAQPEWVLDFFFGDHAVEKLLLEIYQALYGGQRRLAAMGIRAFLEQLMISKVGDQGSFQKNMDVFCDQGYISLVQRDAMSVILDTGHAVIHRLHEPSAEELNTALDIAEGIYAAINVHADAVVKIADKLPKRSPPKEKDSS